MRIGLLVAGSLVCAGCFNPDTSGVEETEDGTSPTSGATAGPMTTAPGTGDGPSATDGSTGEPPADSGTASQSGTTMGESSGTTAVVDDPPAVSLEVNGSDTPAPIEHSGFARLVATADDDNAVARVEFYVGNELVGTVDDAPYEFDLLATSSDNGQSMVRARAYDDADQQTDSDPVEITVGIIGGEVDASMTNLWQTGGLLFNPGGGATVDPDGNIVVMAGVTTTDFEITGVAVSNLASDLSAVNWSVTEPLSLTMGQPQYLPMGQPVVNGNGEVLLMGGNTLDVDGNLQPNASIFRFAADGTGPLAFVEVASDPALMSIPVGGVTRDPDGNIFLAGPDETITKFGADDGTVIWESPAGAAFALTEIGLYRMRADEAGDLIVNIADCSGATNCIVSIRKVRGLDGVEQWTQDVVYPSTSFLLSLGVSAPGPGGNVAHVFGPPSGGLRVMVRDTDGSLTDNNLVLPGPDLFRITDAVYDPQGAIIVVGSRETAGVHGAWVGRVTEGGAIAWQSNLDFGTVDDYGLAAVIDPAGKVDVVGFSDMEQIFVAFLGDLWVAQLDL